MIRKATHYTFFLLVLLPLLLSCGTNDAPTKPEDNLQSTSLNKIMPLGASRVEGNRPEFESFRFELWKVLTENKWTFDFIGTRDDPAAYPSVDGLLFDRDHEGRSGWTSGQILGGLDAWLEISGIPDVVLFSSPGGNDALQNLPYNQAISNINQIIDVLQAANPNVTIIIEQMAPGRTDIMTPQLSEYFENIQQDVQTIASEQTTATSQIIPVDMVSGFTDSLLADEVHYNQSGADFVANRYFNVLEEVLVLEN